MDIGKTEYVLKVKQHKTFLSSSLSDAHLAFVRLGPTKNLPVNKSKIIQKIKDRLLVLTEFDIF